MLHDQYTAQKGFTIIEAMIVVTIVGILVTLAIPNMISFIKNQAIIATSNEIVTTLQTARSEAIKRGITVSACFDENGDQCKDPGIGASPPDINFMYVFVDSNNDNDLDSGEEVLFTSNSLNQNIIFKQSSSAGKNIGGSIRFDSRGKASFQTGDSLKTAYLGVCDDRAKNTFGRLITISQSGRASVSRIPETNAFVGC